MKNNIDVFVEKMELEYLPKIPMKPFSNLPMIPAIYFLLDYKKRVLYIGATNNLKRRITSGSGYNYAYIHAKQIRFLLCDSEQLGKYEYRFIEKYRPPCNKTGHPEYFKKIHKSKFARPNWIESKTKPD